MRSASAIRPLPVVAGLLAVVALTGCDTTQNKSARLKISSERTLASREPTKLGEPAKDVEVVDATVLRGDGESAIAVTLRNTGSKAVSDLPLLVGVHKPGGGREYLNDGKDVAYFKAHTPALAAGEDGVWIYTGKQELDPDAAAFAKVGAGPTPPLAPVSSYPQLQLAESAEPAKGSDRVQVDVANEVGFTQYDLTVFAWATKDGRYVAAGRASAGDLDPNETEPVTVKLIGDPRGAEVHVAAPPTIYQ